MPAEMMKFSGTTTTAISLVADLITGANSLAADATQVDNSTLLYTYAKIVLTLPSGFLVSPTAGAGIELWMVEDDVDGAVDESPIPAANDIMYRARYMHTFVVDNQTAADAYVKTGIIDLDGVKKARFFIKNDSGQTIDFVATAITLKVTLFTHEWV